MEADPQRVADTQDWLSRARHDLQAASTLLEGKEKALLLNRLW
jgi:hypothetical protein